MKPSSLAVSLPVSLIVSLTAAAALAACASNASSSVAPDVLTSTEAPAIVTLDVIGMTCVSGCTPRVQTALAAVDCVEDVQVDFAGGTVTVTCRGACDVDALIAALEASGFGGIPR